MGVRDIEALIRERAVLFDPNLDVSPGSPFDTQVTQALVRRLGNDPFTVDLTTFLSDRMSQAFPDLASSEPDVIADLLIKPVTVLWDPVVREVKRVSNISFRDPNVLTVDEADSLGANFFNDRRRGKFSRGLGRIFFSAPQNVSVTPTNFFTSKGGLHFFPTEIQSIRTQEMILNVSSDGLYFFDVNLIAERAGAEFNIGPNELGSVANITAAVRVQNLRRFGSGEDEENAVEYVGRVEQSLSERSLVTLRGIAAKTLNAFPEVSRLNVVGFNDPEMQRDVLRGGGLGSLVSAGVLGTPVPDGEAKIKTRRFAVSDASIDFFALMHGEASSWVLTVFGAFGSTPVALDLTIRRIVSATELDTEEQNFVYSSTTRSWTLRHRELTLSYIPGGILYPDSQNGTVAVADGEVHIGGAYDVHVRGSAFEESTIAIDNVTDDVPLFKGSQLEIAAGPVINLGDLSLGTTYVEGDQTFQTLEDAAFFGYTLQILEGVDAGTYRILSVVQTTGQPPQLTVDPEPTNSGATLYRWRLFDAINIDLVSPKETRIEGEDLRTVQGTDIVDTVSGVNFNDFGVVEGDTLRIVDGPDADDYTLLADPIAPSFDKLQLSRAVTQSRSNLQYVIFRPNTGGGVARPLVRLTKVEILDSSNQPVGSTIPYAKPVDIQTRAFQNPTRGVKHDVRDARLGLLSKKSTGGVFVGGVASTSLVFNINSVSYTVTLPSNDPGIDALVASLTAQLFALTGISQLVVRVGEYLGLRPAFSDIALVGGSARTAIFGNDEYRSVLDIRSEDIDQVGWSSLAPAIDTVSRLDIVQVLDGNNIGYYEAPYELDLNMNGTFPFTDVSTALVLTATDTFSGFAPEVVRRVQIGTRSIGSVRLYFLDPTAFEVDDASRFRLTTSAGELLFLPDPTLAYQRIPALPNGDAPKDGSTTAGGFIFTSASQSLIQSGIRIGDNLEIINHPIAGTVVLTNPVVGLVNTTIVFSLDGGPDRTLTFIRDDASLNTTEVSRDGVVDQINAAAGEEICTLTGSNTIEFETTRDLVIRSSGTSNALILGNVADTSPPQSFSVADRTNLSPHAGSYKIVGVTSTTLTVLTAFQTFITPFMSPVTRQTYRVTRQSVQRITASSMVDNVAEAGLYFFDVELVSLGTGDQWNIDRDQQMTAEGYRSDGYYLTSTDENTTFSPTEGIGLVLSRSILENGVDDDPQNATQITGQNLQITYERAALVNDLQNFLSSDVERVVCSSPLGRNLIPHFVRFDVRYAGGSRESVVVPEIEQYIRTIFPQDALESSDVQKILHNRGATSITNPIDLIALVHAVDRSVYAARSQNSLTTGRLAAFIPDRLDVKRTIT